MNTKQQIALLKAQIKTLESVSKTQDIDSGLQYWTRKGFKVTKSDLKYTAKSGKTYPAVKGVTKDGTKLQLIATRGGAIYTSKAF